MVMVISTQGAKSFQRWPRNRPLFIAFGKDSSRHLNIRRIAAALSQASWTNPADGIAAQFIEEIVQVGPVYGFPFEIRCAFSSLNSPDQPAGLAVKSWSNWPPAGAGSS